jgi:thioredoxin-like negative regulator of GroEL
MSGNACADAVTTTAPAGAQPKPSLLFFHDPRSGRSRRVEGFLAQVLQHRRNHDTFRLYRIDVTQRTDLAKKFAIGTVPTLVVVENKQVKARFQQPRGSGELTRFLQPWLR